MTKKVSIITLGCDKNADDTANLAGALSKQGVQIEADLSKADAVVVHTCSFIEAAKKESIDTILKAAGTKPEKARLFVTGCMVQQHGKEMMEEMPEVDAFLGTGQISQVVDLLDKPKKRFMDRRNPGGFLDPDADIPLTKGKTAYVRLSEGCSHPCSFCVIPKLRGGLQSRPLENIAKEVRRLSQNGVEEILLIGQDTGEWGLDLYGKPDLPKLLRELQEIPGLRWIRTLYMHPRSLTPEMIQVMSEAPETFSYLDLPLQHIDDAILHDMKRGQRETDLRKKLDLIHAKCPDISLRSTFIVGYPGETDKQFKKLESFIKEGHFDYAGAFVYSKEESTPAARKKNQVREKIKQERQTTFLAAQLGVAQKKAEERLGTTEIVLLDETEGDTIIGRTKKEAPEIDAIVRLPREAGNPGQTIKTKLTSWETYEFTGMIRTGKQ